MASAAAQTETATGTPIVRLEQETRLAIVLYGGVSLAIYMYGIVEELFRLVRATAPEIGDGPDRQLAFPKTESTEAVYRRLGQLLPVQSGPAPVQAEPAGAPAAELPADAPVRTRFVVDLIAGSSAGGINGIFLAKALANETDPTSLRKLWIEQGDIGSLLNDAGSAFSFRSREYAPAPGSAPKSVLNGSRMTSLLIDALGGLELPDKAEATGTRLVDELDLWVTATDLDGLPVPIQLSRGTTAERRYAHRSHFRFSRRDGRNDFVSADSDFTGYAARCTASFPGAFEPMRLDSLTDLGLQTKPAWSSFYPAYRDPSAHFGERWFSDGGILDNKPFTYVTRALTRRHADLPVDRKLIYVEPDPTAPRLDAPLTPEWNAVDTAKAALTGIPRSEGIRDDIQAVLSRNRSIERVRELIGQLGTSPSEQAFLTGLVRQERSAAWGATALSASALEHPWGPAYATYARLKVRGLVDYLASLVVAAAGLDPESDQAFALHYVIRAWKDENYAEQPAPRSPQKTDNAFMLDFDLPYRIRRLGFVLQKLREIRDGQVAPVELACAAYGLPVDSLAALDAAELNALTQRLNDLRGQLTAAEAALADPQGPLAATVAGAGITGDSLERILDEVTDAGMLAQAKTIVDTHADAFAEAAGLIAAAFRAAASEVSERLDEELPRLPEDGTASASGLSRERVALRFFYDAYEAYDSILYEINYATELGEANPVDVLRISPRDTTQPSEVSEQRRQLLGVRLNHFGAFLNQSWRRHDIVWGRLNGAECLIRALLPAGHPDAEELIEQAQRRIVEDFASEYKIDPAQSWHWFCTTYDATPLEADAVYPLLRRGATVLTSLVAGLISPKAPATGPAPPPRLAAKAWAAVTAVLPPHPGSLPTLFGALWRFAAPVVLAAVLVPFVLVAGGLALALALDGALSILGWSLFGLGAGLALMLTGTVLLLRLLVHKARAPILARVRALVHELAAR